LKLVDLDALAAGLGGAIRSVLAADDGAHGAQAEAGFFGDPAQ
jgi:hypothetical protein